MRTSCTAEDGRNQTQRTQKECFSKMCRFVHTPILVDKSLSAPCARRSKRVLHQLCDVASICARTRPLSRPLCGMTPSGGYGATYLLDDFVVVEHVFAHAPAQRVVRLLARCPLRRPLLSVLRVTRHRVCLLQVPRMRWRHRTDHCDTQRKRASSFHRNGRCLVR